MPFRKALTWTFQLWISVTVCTHPTLNCPKAWPSPLRTVTSPLPQLLLHPAVPKMKKKMQMQLKAKRALKAKTSKVTNRLLQKVTTASRKGLRRACLAST